MKKNNLFDLVPFFRQKKREVEENLERAKVQTKEITLKAKEEALRIEKKAEEQARSITQEAIILEKKLHSKENELDGLKNSIKKERKNLEQERAELKKKREEILSKLERVAKLGQKEAKELILAAWEEKLKGDVAKRIRDTEEETKAKADERAREILVDAIRYGAVDYTAEYTLSTVALPSDEFKGRIIGKEGRNIRAFELATGVDVDLEEEGIIKFSSFDAVRREIAKVSMERLIRDGRIQPQRIEEIVKKTEKEIERIITKEGERLCHKVGIYNLPNDLIRLLGRFKYRYSYGQNMILHTLEETKIGTALAHELGADVDIVKLGCLLHDIGKVIIEKEGSHVQLGVDLLKKHKISREVVDCVASHHEDVPFSSMEGIIVYIADAVSGGRPGARHEDFEEYLKRIKTIEEAAKTKKGVAEAYALQAGRELRVMVVPQKVTDDEAVVLAREIKEEIEEKFPTFPGQVKITIIRETRAFATTHS